jgi:hypothetical protein
MVTRRAHKIRKPESKRRTQGRQEQGSELELQNVEVLQEKRRSFTGDDGPSDPNPTASDWGFGSPVALTALGLRR